MKRALLAIGVLLVAGAVGVYVFVVRPLVVPTEPTPAVEAALGAPDVVLLAGVNVKQLAFIERWYLGVPVIAVAHETPGRAPLDRTLLDHLRAAKVDARRDLDYVLYALYRTDGADLHHAVVLVGRFNPAAIDDYVAHELHGLPSTAGDRLSHELTIISPTDCKPGGTWTVTADRSWIVIADPASRAVVLPRLAAQASDARDQLAWWRALARTDVVSVGLWDVKDADKAVPHPFQKGIAKGLSTEAGAFAHLYFGLGVRTVPPEGRLRLVLDAADAPVAAQKIAGWQRALRESRAQWAQTVPTVAALYDSLTFHSEGPRSSLEFAVNRTLARNLQGVVNELLSAVLAGFGVQHPAGADTAQRVERIDTDPVVFQATASASALGVYDPAATFAEDVDQTQGPFGLRLGEVRLGSTPDVGLEVVVEGFAGAIPNVTAESRRARLFVDSVKSRAGQELLRPEACGRERNDEPTSFTTSLGSRLKATKAARLIPDADPHALQSVSGHVELRLPTRTETVTIPRPEPGTKIERNGATFVVTSVTVGTVGYQIIGTRDKILHFLARNASGQPLASTAAFSADFLLGEGVAGQKEYAGVVDRIEVVFTVEEQTIRAPFTLSDFSFAGKLRAVSRDTTPPFRPYGYQALRRDRPRLPGPGKPGVLAVVQLEPFELSLDKAATYFGTALEFTFRSPIIPGFERAFTVGRLRLTRVELRDGTVLEPPPAGAPTKPMTVAPVWDAPIRFGTAPKDGALTTSLRLFLDAKVKPEDIKALRGVVTVQFPRTLQALRLDDLTPGQHAELRDFTVTVTAHGRKGFTLQANDDGDRLLYTRIASTDGQPIAFFNPQITVTPEGAWRFELSPLGAPVGAELVVAGQIDRKAYPFTLVPK
jgi:hypothetical protein